MVRRPVPWVRSPRPRLARRRERAQRLVLADRPTRKPDPGRQLVDRETGGGVQGVGVDHLSKVTDKAVTVNTVTMTADRTRQLSKELLAILREQTGVPVLDYAASPTSSAMATCTRSTCSSTPRSAATARPLRRTGTLPALRRDLPTTDRRAPRSDRPRVAPGPDLPTDPGRGRPVGGGRHPRPTRRPSVGDHRSGDRRAAPASRRHSDRP